MAISVPVPKDLSGIKTKVALNLTKRQIICFSTAAITGLPPHSPERQEEFQALVLLQHHRNFQQGHQSSDLGIPRADKGVYETPVSGLVWGIPKIPSDPEFQSF